MEVMMKYVYPVIFTPDGENMLASAPDLPGLHTFGNSLADVMYMAQDAMEMWLWDAENNNEPIPPASSQSDMTKQCENPRQFVSLIAADTDEYRRQTETHAVKKTLSIPAWLNIKAEKANAPFSQILQQGLKEYLRVG
jgi:predicted RNase H-like HicB family nuclease